MTPLQTIEVSATDQPGGQHPDAARPGRRRHRLPALGRRDRPRAPSARCAGCCRARRCARSPSTAATACARGTTSWAPTWSAARTKPACANPLRRCWRWSSAKSRAACRRGASCWPASRRAAPSRWVPACAARTGWPGLAGLSGYLPLAAHTAAEAHAGQPPWPACTSPTSKAPSTGGASARPRPTASAPAPRCARWPRSMR
jgi:hypothetical protein